MTLTELKGNIASHSIPERWYSIDDGLKPDAIILYKNYAAWECFYLSERGDRMDSKIFHNDEDAYQYLWDRLKSNWEFFLNRKK